MKKWKKALAQTLFWIAFPFLAVLGMITKGVRVVSGLLDRGYTYLVDWYEDKVWSEAYGED